MLDRLMYIFVGAVVGAMLITAATAHVPDPVMDLCFPKTKPFPKPKGATVA